MNPDPEIRSVKKVQCCIVFPSSRLDHRISSSRNGFTWLIIGVSRWALVHTVPSDYIYQAGNIFPSCFTRRTQLHGFNKSDHAFFSFYAIIVFSPFSVSFENGIFCVRREWKVNSSFILMLHILLCHEIVYTVCSAGKQILFYCSSCIFCCKSAFRQSIIYGYFNV